MDGEQLGPSKTLGITENKRSKEMYSEQASVHTDNSGVPDFRVKKLISGKPVKFSKRVKSTKPRLDLAQAASRLPFERRLESPANEMPGRGLNQSALGARDDPPMASANSAKPLVTLHEATTISAWLLLRNGAGSSSLAPAGQLGASQAGVRMQFDAFDLGTRFGVGLNGRVSGAVGSPHQLEGAAGVYLKLKGSIPSQIIAERRHNLGGGGRDAFALIFATGIDEKPLGGGFRISGYGQSGIVGVKKKDLFVDGSIRVERKLEVQHLPTFRIGGGVWGAAQAGVTRLDLGPRISTTVETRGIRLNIGAEWRQRVMGNASPGSGPAIVLSTDFRR